MIAFLDKLEEIINKIVGLVLTPMFMILAAVSLLQVVFRYFLRISLPWSEELARYLFIYTTYLGSVIGVSRNIHIDITAVDLFLDKMEPARRQRWNEIIDVVTSFLSAFVLAWITYLAIPYLMGVYKFGQRTPAMGLSLCVPVFSVPLGMGLMFLLYVKKFIKSVLLFGKGGASLD